MPDTRTLVLTGQCLIKREVHHDATAGFAAVKRLVRAGDEAFTNFEGTIKGSFGGAPTKEEFFSAPSPGVLDSLKDVGFDLLSLCNNHAFDYGEGGVRSTLAEVAGRGFVAAGAGLDLSEAGRVGYLRTDGGVIALVAMDCGPQADRVYARDADTERPASPGINPMRLVDDGKGPVPNEADLRRNLAAVAEARANADLVMVYTHSHHWAEDMWDTLPAMATLSKGWVDAGADVVLGHGTPAFQGIDVYRGKPILHGLGNFIFHSYRPQRWLDWVGILPWQGVVASCTWSKGSGVTRVDLTPISIGHDHDPGGDLPQAFGDVPVIPPEAYGDQILSRMARLSAVLGTEIRREGDIGVLDIG